MIPHWRHLISSSVKFGTHTVARRDTSCVVTMILFTTWLSALVFGTPALADTVTVLPIRCNDLVYDPAVQRVYLSLPSSAGPGGNSIAAVDPITGSVGAHVFVGSEPNRLALSGDSHYLYVGLDGSSEVRQLDLLTGTVGPSFSLGVDPFFGPRVAADLAVAPGLPQTVAVATAFLYTVPPAAGVMIFDHGAPLPAQHSYFEAASSIAFSSNPGRLYGYTPDLRDLVNFTLTGDGVSGVAGGQVLEQTNREIRFQGGRIYGSTGSVVDPEAHEVVGQFTGLSANSVVAPDVASGRVFFLSQAMQSGAWSLIAYDLETFVPIGSLALPGIKGQPSGLVRWGADGVAFRTNADQLFLVRTSLVPADRPTVDLTIQSNAGATVVTSGKPATLGFTVRNSGDTTAHHVLLMDTLPGGAKLDLVEGAPCEVFQTGGVVTINLGDLPPGSQVTLALHLTAGSPGTYQNIATASSGDPETNVADNATWALVIVNTAPPPVGADLSGTWNSVFEAGPHRPRNHQKTSIRGKFTVRNSGNTAATTSFVVRFYLSHSDGFDLPTAILLKEVTVPGLEAGGSLPIAFHVPWPRQAPGGETLFAVVDPTKAVAELRQDDKVIAASIPLP